MRIGKSRGPASGWVKKALCSGVALGLAMAMGATSVMAGPGNGNGGNGEGDSYGNDGFKTLTPFSRVAKLPAVRNELGEIDYKKSYDKARAASIAIATYVARMKESDMLGIDVIKGVDWKLGGTSTECLEDRECSDEEINHNVLAIPSPDPINPNDPAYLADGTVTKANTKKGNVIEFCNKKYASMAMGVTKDGAGDILPGRTIVNGWAHAPALPCEVSVWHDEENIYVDMLDPSAIFTLFFSDVLFSEDMQDPEFADALNAMPPQVKAEIVAIIHAALAEFDPATKSSDQMIGPKYKSIGDIIAAVDASPLDSPYLHHVYTSAEGDFIFNNGHAKAVAQSIINTMSIHGETGPTGAGKHPTEITVDIYGDVVEDREDDPSTPDVDEDDGDTLVTLDDVLSTKSSWRSARIEPIKIPGANFIIEACSPKYAKMAMGTGLHHVNALPCEITVKIIDNGKKLVISYLDPNFMLGALFADISDEDKAKFGAIPDLINDDLQNIVKAAVDNSGIALKGPERKEINMLPLPSVE